MSRNYFQAKNYKWSKTHGMISCAQYTDKDKFGETVQEPWLFHIYDEGMEDNLINAYMKGYEDGRKHGKRDLQSELKRLLAINDR
jgi:hypothetical protein